MNTLDVLEEALSLAERSGFEVRREWLEETTGGVCRIGSKWVLYVDLSLPIDEQLAQVVKSLNLTGQVLPDSNTSRTLSRLLQG